MRIAAVGARESKCKKEFCYTCEYLKTFSLPVCLLSIWKRYLEQSLADRAQLLSLQVLPTREVVEAFDSKNEGNSLRKNGRLHSGSLCGNRRLKRYAGTRRWRSFQESTGVFHLKGVAKSVTFQRKPIGRVKDGSESESDFTDGGNYNHDTLRNRPCS